MSYTLTLTSTMRNSVYALQQIEKQTNTENEILSTGNKVNSALDNPLKYFTSQDHLYRASDLEGRKDEMSEATELVTAANDGVESILKLIDSAQSLGNEALTAEDSSDSSDLEKQYNAILTQIDQLASDAYYKGTNLLGGTTESLTVHFNADGTSSLTLNGKDASSTGLGLTAVTTGNWWDTTNTAANKTNIQTNLDALTAAKKSLRTMAKTLSSQASIISTRSDFTDNMVTVLRNGSSNLISADSNDESAKLTMLTTQQSLAIKSLSIGSTAYSNVLKIFG
ncbi:MAG: flagellin [Deltaproteobacteria bacterium]|nr:flagellin [Deltaproteobacteria bacterium]